MTDTGEKINLGVDEDGFVCVVAPDAYSGYVDEDWALDQLLARFIEQMNQGSLFVAYPGPDNADDDLAFCKKEPAERFFREATGIVRVGEAGLWLTNYTQLTMAAQFRDSQPVAKFSRRLPVEPGTYRITLIEESTNPSKFQLSVTPAITGTITEHSSVPWFD